MHDAKSCAEQIGKELIEGTHVSMIYSAHNMHLSSSQEVLGKNVVWGTFPNDGLCSFEKPYFKITGESKKGKDWYWQGIYIIW